MYFYLGVLGHNPYPVQYTIGYYDLTQCKTGNIINIVEECMFYFNFHSVSMRIDATELLILPNDLQPVKTPFAKCIVSLIVGVIITCHNCIAQCF